MSPALMRLMTSGLRSNDGEPPPDDALSFEPLLLSLPPPPHPTTSASAPSASTTTSHLPTSRFIAGTPSLSAEPVWTGTRCSARHRVPDRHPPVAPCR